MTERQHKIIAAILHALHGLEGGQFAETILHAEVNLRVTPTASKSEFDDALSVADNNGWIIGVQSRFGKGRLWNLSDAGLAARLEMR